MGAGMLGLSAAWMDDRGDPAAPVLIGGHWLQILVVASA